MGGGRRMRGSLGRSPIHRARRGCWYFAYPCGDLRGRAVLPSLPSLLSLPYHLSLHSLPSLISLPSLPYLTALPTLPSYPSFPDC